MSTFASVDEQLTYLKKGSAEVIREAELRAKLEKSRATGKPLRVKLGMLAVSAMWPGLIDKNELYDARENKHGIHGGQSETSVMLHLHPDLVEMDKAVNFVPLTVPRRPLLSKSGPTPSRSSTKLDRKSTRLNSSHTIQSRMPSSA